MEKIKLNSGDKAALIVFGMVMFCVVVGKDISAVALAIMFHGILSKF